MKINIGAGNKKFEGFLNCDYSNYFPQDYIFDLEKDKFPFKDNSITHVIAHHVLEHLGEGYFHCLKELYRVCKDGAIIFIKVPHYRHENFFHDPTHKRPITKNGLTLFSKEFNTTNGSSASKLGLMYDIDFKVIDYKEVLDRNHNMFNNLKNLTLNEILEFTKDKVNIIEETIIYLQVIK